MKVTDKLRAALQERFPWADFTRYLAFIESRLFRSTAEKSERHHILPIVPFQEFEKCSDNVIRLSLGDHLRAHYLLALAVPEFGPFQMAFFVQSNYKKYAHQIPEAELATYARVYEIGREGSMDAWRRVGYAAAACGRLQAQAQRAGRLGGQKNVESGHARRLGQLAVARGQIQALGRKYAPIYGPIARRECRENGTGIHAPGIAAKGGRASGAIAVASGHIERLGYAQGNKNRKNGHIQRLGDIYGPIQGQKNKESGQMRAIGRAYGAINGPRNAHMAHHFKKGVLRPGCRFCYPEKII